MKHYIAISIIIWVFGITGYAIYKVEQTTPVKVPWKTMSTWEPSEEDMKRIMAHPCFKANVHKFDGKTVTDVADYCGIEY